MDDKICVMSENLLNPSWRDLDQNELRLLLEHRIGGPGQFDGREQHPNIFYLPLAREACRVKLVFDKKVITRIEPGPAFNRSDWGRISDEIANRILVGPTKVGREFSFSSVRVPGAWTGAQSGVQILPPPADAPQAPVEMAEHPFILEFPMRTTDVGPITTYRRIQAHQRLSRLLNVLLTARVSAQLLRPEHFWAYDPATGTHSRWLQRGFFATLGKPVLDQLSPRAAEGLRVVNSEEYYPSLGNDYDGLSVPDDLDSAICRYRALTPKQREKFDRAAYWMDLASRQWTTSMSVSYASLVSAIEALTDRGQIHNFTCPVCREPCSHEVPGPTERFRAFFDAYAPGASLRPRRSKMYTLRSEILHGSDLMEMDQGRVLGWGPPWWHERELHEELWSLSRCGLRNWLQNPSEEVGPQ